MLAGGGAYYYSIQNKVDDDSIMYQTKEECESKTGKVCDNSALCDYKCPKSYHKGWWAATAEVLNKTSEENSNLTSPVSADWKTYTNEKYGFSFEYPQDWSLSLIDEIEVNNGSHLVSIDNNIKYTGYPPSGSVYVLFSIVKISDKFDNWKLLNYKKIFDLQVFTTSFPIKTSEIKYSEKVINGHEVLIKSYEHLSVPEGLAPASKEIAVDLGGSKILLIQANAPLPGGENLITIVEDILATLKFTK